jgi:predicted enzyme related to lactoylglutathione lyase
LLKSQKCPFESILEAGRKKAEDLGVKIVMSLTDIPDFGRMCVIQDPQVVAISIITYVDMQ